MAFADCCVLTVWLYVSNINTTCIREILCLCSAPTVPRTSLVAENPWCVPLPPGYSSSLLPAMAGRGRDIQLHVGIANQLPACLRMCSSCYVARRCLWVPPSNNAFQVHFCVQVSPWCLSLGVQCGYLSSAEYAIWYIVYQEGECSQ